MAFVSDKGIPACSVQLPAALASDGSLKTSATNLDLGASIVGHRITEVRFTWTVAKLMETLAAYEDATLLFTLTFTWNADSTLQKVVRI